MSAVLPSPKVGDIWYRYEDKRYSVTVDAERDEYSTRLEVKCWEYKVAKVTPKGVQLELLPGAQRHFVRLDAYKRFACPTKELALESFRARKTRQAGIYEARAADAHRAMRLAEGKDFFEALSERGNHVDRIIAKIGELPLRNIILILTSNIPIWEAERLVRKIEVRK